MIFSIHFSCFHIVEPCGCRRPYSACFYFWYHICHSFSSFLFPSIFPFYCHVFLLSYFLIQRCVQILKSSREISMTVRAPPSSSMYNSSHSAPLHGFGPPRDTYLPPPNRQTCSWMDRHGRPASPPYEYGGRRPDRRDRYELLTNPGLRYHAHCYPIIFISFLFRCCFVFIVRLPLIHRRVRRVDLLIEPGQSLGLMIRGGAEYGLGIFVTGVDKGSVADRAGLQVSLLRTAAIPSITL